MASNIKVQYSNVLEEKDIIRKDNRGKQFICDIIILQVKSILDKKWRIINLYTALREIVKSLIKNRIKKYGINNFTLIILDWCDVQDLTIREQYWIDLYNPEYNILKVAKSSTTYDWIKKKNVWTTTLL